MPAREATPGRETVIEKEKQIVAFSLGSETYGVDIAQVREIIPIQKIVPVPRAPDFVEGIINLRGRVIPVLDLRHHFGFEKKKQDPDQRIVLTEVDGESIGVIVDSVSSVLRIPEASIEPPASVITGDDIEYIQGIAKVGSNLIVLLDLTKIISDAEKRTLKEVDLASAVVR
ncbi:MAG: purine-binding chemotaxis protein CheW [Candidatus Fermentithermobacillus carboniphilus]|uniref:Purine-binding chemotaxis protein CheW n=1 Tax=Candidatus Fermentithermobacillus carboniphilus TaxID=3085328 RepID=A0AAT9LCN5_9FIRM|nr:MAG: purine-binding chemotaxis protein CheW [Candidatus Fermentithermobacillus carboniphilus]